jgi:hypothetical protein
LNDKIKEALDEVIHKNSVKEKMQKIMGGRYFR